MNDTAGQSIPEKNKEIVRFSWNAIFNKLELAICDEVIAPDYTFNGQAPGGSAAESVKEFAKSVHAAYPDVVFDILDVLGDGDKVAIRYTVTGTHSGTAQLMETMATNILTMVDGRCTANWQTGGTMHGIDHLQATGH